MRTVCVDKKKKFRLILINLAHVVVMCAVLYRWRFHHLGAAGVDEERKFCCILNELPHVSTVSVDGEKNYATSLSIRLT